MKIKEVVVQSAGIFVGTIIMMITGYAVLMTGLDSVINGKPDPMDEL